jgi:hypothetical protein
MNTSPNGDATPQSVHLPHNILTLAKQCGFTKANGDVNKKALAEAAGIPDSTFYRNIDKPGKFAVEHLDWLADALGTTTAELFAPPAELAAGAA